MPRTKNPGALIKISSNGAKITFSSENSQIGKVFEASKEDGQGKTTTYRCFTRFMTKDESKGGNTASFKFNDHNRGTTSQVVIGGGRRSRETSESDDDDADDEGYDTDRRPRQRQRSGRSRDYHETCYSCDSQASSSGTEGSSSTERESGFRRYIPTSILTTVDRFNQSKKSRKSKKKSTRSHNTTRSTSRWRGPKYDRAKANDFDEDKFAEWTERHRPETITEVMDLSRILDKDFRTNNGKSSLHATVYGARKLHSLFRSSCPDRDKVVELDKLLDKVYSHAKVDHPSEAFKGDLIESPPGPDIPAESLYAYLDSHAFYASAGRFIPESYRDWGKRKDLDQNTRDRAANCSHVLAAALPKAPSTVNLEVLTENLAHFGAHFAKCSRVSIPDWTGKVVGLMDASGYSAAQCSAMSEKAATVLDTVNKTRLGIGATDVNEVPWELYNALQTKAEPTETTQNTSLPARKTLETTRRWLCSPAYESESEGSSEYNSRDRGSSLPRRGSGDTAYYVDDSTRTERTRKRDWFSNKWQKYTRSSHP